MGKIELTKDEALLIIRLFYFYLDFACCIEEQTEGAGKQSAPGGKQ